MGNFVSLKATCHSTVHGIGRSADQLAGLLEEAALGHDRSFAALYDATAARAHGLALRVLRDPGLAEEVTQEAYLEVWRRAREYDRTRGSAVARVHTIVHRRAVDRVRSAQASARRDEVYLRRALAGTDGDTTSGTALASVEARRVRAALACLPPQQRNAIRLAYFEGLSYSEVAAAVGAPPGTVKSRIRSGLQRLREVLEGAEPKAC